MYDRRVNASGPVVSVARPPDAPSAAASWRPQRFSESGVAEVHDPLIEPLWTGLRVVALVDGTTATIRDLDGDGVDEFADVEAELAAASRASRLVLDGYLTHQAIQKLDVVARRDSDESPKASSAIGQMWFGGLGRRRRPKPPPIEAEGRDPVAVDGDVAIVIVDLLWLDDEPLLDVPLLERKRLLESVIAESRLVRRGIYVRPPVDTWLGSWRSLGFSRLAYKGANSRYLPGATNPQWRVAELPVR